MSQERMRQERIMDKRRLQEIEKEIEVLNVRSKANHTVGGASNKKIKQREEDFVAKMIEDTYRRRT